MTIEAERRMPPHAAGTVELFRKRGHVVEVRELRDNAGLRYALDGFHECTALALSNRYRKIYEKKSK